MSSDIRLLVVAKDQTFRLNETNTTELGIQITKIGNNTFPLAAVYNNFLKDIRTQENKPDFVVFMHADVDIDLKHFIEHIEACKDKYDVIGLCGTSIFNVSQSPLNWWTGSNPTPYAKWGCVTHGELGGKKSFFSEDRKEQTDAEVACIDGLCIVFGHKAIESDMLFDEQFAFDFYDSDISLQTILKQHLKLGVVVEESLQHYSVGKSILSQDFLKHEVEFRKKWGLPIPNTLQKKLVDQRS